MRIATEYSHKRMRTHRKSKEKRAYSTNTKSNKEESKWQGCKERWKREYSAKTSRAKKKFNNRIVRADEHVGIGTRGLESKTTPMAKPF